ncbi:hypothetical protein BC936DRAFT_143662 [Jimgerdemannia flammicorona]|uniref:VLIG-type G domain-containing protein n=1 Tax=Jimgerdemannia flammicorona TaxID=994334 RepID=A0A433DDI7_9FUNG|nr:hypothetical protein BC936DRAFT_143662 [Jimgerdemannia flammicorona]
MIIPKQEGLYVEDMSFTFPKLKDGVCGLGDLWDCHLSKPSGSNLFTKEPEKGHMKAESLQNFDYRLTRVRSAEDKFKMANIGGAMSIELLSGLIKVEYDDAIKNASDGHLVVQYLLESYSVKLLPQVKEIVDDSVKNRLLSGEIKATHVVCGMTLGAEVNAHIFISRETSSREGKNRVLGKLAYGPIDTSLKAELELMDAENGGGHETRIIVQSKPPMKTQPSTIKQVFELVEKIDTHIAAERHFQIIDASITGVPIRFELVPVGQFLDLKLEKLYLQLHDDILERFRVILLALQDFRISGYVWNSVLEIEPRLHVILSDPKSPLSEQITIYEKELREAADIYFGRAYKALEAYKIARSKDVDLVKIVREYSACEFSVMNVYAKIEEFVLSGKGELRGVHEGGAKLMKVDITLFSNPHELDDWINTETNIKILLRTGGQSSDGAFRHLFALRKLLQQNGVDVGIALPCISDEFSLTIKVYDKAAIHHAVNIPHVLSILSVAVGMGEPIETRFHEINASQFGKHLPLQQERLNDLNELVSMLNFNQGVYLARSRMDTLERLSCRHSEDDTKWKLFVSLDALDAVIQLRTLRSQLTFGDIEWIVGTLGPANLYAAPLLCVFRGGELRAVCLDNLDLLILVHLANNKPQDSQEPDFSFLSPYSLDHSLYPDRARFAIELMKTMPKVSGHRPDSARFEMPAFQKLPDQSLSDALDVARSILAGDTVNVISTIARHVVRQHPEIERLLIPHGWVGRFSEKIISKQNCKSLCGAITAWVNSQDPFLEKVESARSTIEHVLSLPEEMSEELKKAAELPVKAVMDDPRCPDEVRKAIVDSIDYDFKPRCKAVLGSLNKRSVASGDTCAFLQITVLSSLLRQMSQIGNEEFPTSLNVYPALTMYVDRFGELRRKEEMDTYLENRQLYHIVSFLAKHAYDPQLSVLHYELDRLIGIDILNRKEDRHAIVKFFNSLSSESQFTEAQWSDLWQNSRFLYLARAGIKEQVVSDTIASMVRKSIDENAPLPNYLPQDIRNNLKEKYAWEKFEMPGKLNTIEDVMLTLGGIISNNDEVPELFRKVFAESLVTNQDLERSLSEANVLFYWDTEKKVFKEPWQLKHIKDAWQNLEQWKEPILDTPTTPSEQVLFRLDIDNFEETDICDVEFNIRDGPLEIHEKWQSVMGETLSAITPTDFVKLHSIIASPKIPAANMAACVNTVLPFIIQRVKMWGTDVLRSENVSALVQDETKSVPASGGGSAKVGPSFGRRLVKAPANTASTQLARVTPLSRFDCISGLLCSARSTVAQDIVRIISQFPMPLPLVIPDLEQENVYKVMLPSLLGPTIKWESEPGMIVENHLFQSPFQLLVAIRLGTHSTTGKSTILNQVMITKNMFSSRAEPGAERGKPRTLDGSVEFTWLTQETCGTSLWKFVLERYYGRGEKSIVLLANLHGDAVEYPDVIQFLNQFASVFLVFMMPDCDEDKWNKFNQMIDSDDQIVYAMVDPVDGSEEPEENVIDTKRLMEDGTLAKVRSMFDQALNSVVRTSQAFGNFKDIQLGSSLRFTEGIECLESRNLVKFVTERTCYKTRKTMRIQANRSAALSAASPQKYQSQDEYRLWSDNPDLRKLISLFVKVLNLPLAQRQRALAHLERDLSRLSTEESSASRAQVAKCQEELWRTLGLKDKSEVQRRIRTQIAHAMERVDSINLGAEHFFRELGQIYEIALVANRDHPANASVLQLPERYAELLIAGHAIELLDGDSSSIPDAWLSAICDHVCVRFPNLRVFVVTILGLQSSGKSTLLNALFACRFAVSVGRCTRGLFMRLLFLEEDLREKLQVDAILLIDTEGLGAPEKANDVNAERKDRMLATFAMGVSNLTLINILGEYMRDLTDILQIAIVAMTRLEEAGMSPDLLMVQHLTERNKGKSSQGTEQFRKALELALDLATKKDDQIGAAGADCLKNLIMRLQPGQNNLLKQFRPFKNGASAYAPPSAQYHEDVVDLYETILQSCQQAQNKMNFKEWHTLVRSYWSSLSHENFSVQFKNVKEIIEFIGRGEMIAKVKEAIEAAFHVHSAELKNKIRSEVQQWINMQNVDDKQREIFLERVSSELVNIPKVCLRANTGNPSSRLCQQCAEAAKEWDDLFAHVKRQDCEQSTMVTIKRHIKHVHQSTMTILTQTLDALLVKQNYNMEFMRHINNRLNEELDKQPTGKRFTNEERKTIVDSIWDEIYRIASSKDNVVPVKRQIDDEVTQEYSNMPDSLMDLYHSAEPVCLRKKIVAIDTSGFLSRLKRHHLKEPEIDWLEDQFGQLPRRLLDDQESDHFKTGDVRVLHKRITESITKFERQFNVKLTSAFKHTLQVYVLKKFIVEMEQIQRKWDDQNSPVRILGRMEKEYRSTIDKRLLYGFSFASEGYIVGEYLFRAIMQKAENAGNEARVNSVLGLSWILNSQNVRLLYLRELAVEVQRGRLQKAILFFRNPKHRIDQWFKSKVDAHVFTETEEEFDTTFDNEFRQVRQKISNGDTIQKMQNFIKHYTTNGVDWIEYTPDEKLIKGAIASDVDVFRESILKVLDNEETMRRYRENGTFTNPSQDERVMRRLGCTEACFWCGALCWGERGHYNNTDNTRKHHSCHQPAGLAGTHNRKTNELRAMACDKRKDDAIVHWGDYHTDGITWRETKLHEDFKGWKFQAHSMNQFNTLMRWFFFKLHKRLAYELDMQPSSPSDLSENNCVDTNLISILATIEQNVR